MVKLTLIVLAYTTQVNSAFRARWLASSEISQVLFTSEQPKNGSPFQISTNKVILKQVKLRVRPASYSACVVYTKTIIHTSVSLKVVDIYLAALRLGKYPPLSTWIIVNYYTTKLAQRGNN